MYVSLYNVFNRINNISFYHKYKNKLKKYLDNLSHEEQAFHYSKLINYLVIRHNREKSDFLSAELFEIYEQFLDKEYYIDSKVNYLKPEFFRAILLNAIDCSKYEWAEYFIKTYQIKVPGKDRDSMYYYGYALLYNSIDRNNNALEFIEKIKINNFIFKYDIYNIKLKIFLEYKDPQKALDLIHSYNEYLRKDKFFSEERKIPYRNFIKFAKDIIYCMEGKPNYEPNLIKKQIEENKKILNRSWLLKIISSMK